MTFIDIVIRQKWGVVIMNWKLFFLSISNNCKGIQILINCLKWLLNDIMKNEKISSKMVSYDKIVHVSCHAK